MRLLAVFFAVTALPGEKTVAELRPGVWVGNDPALLPLPVSGYQAYLIGEVHGVQENVTAFRAYLEVLLRTGLRDVALEEDSVYERDAQAYVTGNTSRFRNELCLRAGVLNVIRELNLSRRANDLIRVHLVDIDSPAAAIHEHLTILKGQSPDARSLLIPTVDELKDRGLGAVEAFRRALPVGSPLQDELTTIGYSIRAYQDGLEVGDWRFKGSPYLDSREEAIAANVKRIVSTNGFNGLLMQYGSDHVSKAERKDGGPNRESVFAPMALRLERSGVRVFSLLTIPLSGNWQWRGRKGEMFWAPSDASLSTGESLDQLLVRAGRPKFFRECCRSYRSVQRRRSVNGAHLRFLRSLPLRSRYRKLHDADVRRAAWWQRHCRTSG